MGCSARGRAVRRGSRVFGLLPPFNPFEDESAAPVDDDEIDAVVVPQERDQPRQRVLQESRGRSAAITSSGAGSGPAARAGDRVKRRSPPPWPSPGAAASWPRDARGRVACRSRLERPAGARAAPSRSEGSSLTVARARSHHSRSRRRPARKKMRSVAPRMLNQTPSSRLTPLQERGAPHPHGHLFDATSPETH